MLTFWEFVFPELRLVDDRVDRKRIMHLVLDSILRQWVFFIYAIIICTCVIYLRHLFLLHGIYYAPYDSFGWGLLMGFFVGPVWLFINGRSMRKLVRLELNKRRIFVCRQCGYCLRGLEQIRCPECGSAYNGY